MKKCAWHCSVCVAVVLGTSALSSNAHSQQVIEATYAAKQAIRCSIVFSMSAGLTASKSAAADRTKISGLMRQFAIEGAGREQALVWLDEMEAEFRDSKDLAFLRQDTDRCKTLLSEQSQWFEEHWPAPK